MGTGAPFVPTPFPTTQVAAQAANPQRALPYVSPTDFRYAPTAVGTLRLVSGSVAVSQDSLASLSFVLQRASSWADEICFKGRAGGHFQAHPVTESQYVVIKPSGAFDLTCNFKPVIEVVGLALGAMPSQLTNLTGSAAQDIYIEGKVIHVPAAWSTTPMPLYAYPADTSNKIYVVWTYVCGWPNFALIGGQGFAANKLAKGANSLVLASPAPAGIYSGSQLTIVDGQNTENVTISATPSSTTINLVGTTQFDHTVPALPDFVRVTSLPPAIEEATILLASILVKVQGSRALVLQGAAGSLPTQQAVAMAGASGDYNNARELLKRHEVVFLHD